MRRKQIIIGLSFLLALVALYLGYKANRNFLKHYPRVQAALVSRGDLIDDTEVAGRVIAEEIRDLYINSQAKVQAVLVTEGDPVHTGRVLLIFDSDDKKLQLAQCRAQILSSEQKLAIQKTDGFSENGLKISETDLQVLYLQRDKLEKEIRELTVTSPINGRVSLLTPKVGETVNPGAKIAQIINEGKLTVEAEVPADDGIKIKIGDKAEISYGTIAEPYAAAVTQILPPLRNQDNSYSNLRIKLGVIEQGVILIPGSSVQVRVRFGRAKLAVTVPVEAIHEELTTVRGDREYFSVRPESGAKRNYLYVLKDCSETLGVAEEPERRWMIRDNIYQARKVYVETGISSVDRVEIIKGLRPFEQVIIYSDRAVQDYDRVIVINRDQSYKQPLTVGGGG
jgi:multidrug efflux pump subunit AcrA (membrane-fusion protein)